jgi:hypothetical protein
MHDDPLETNAYYRNWRMKNSVGDLVLMTWDLDRFLPLVAGHWTADSGVLFLAEPCQAEGWQQGQKRRVLFHAHDARVTVRSLLVVYTKAACTLPQVAASTGVRREAQAARSQVQVSASPVQHLKQRRRGLLSITPLIWVDDRRIRGQQMPSTLAQSPTGTCASVQDTRYQWRGGCERRNRRLKRPDTQLALQRIYLWMI